MQKAYIYLDGQPAPLGLPLLTEAETAAAIADLTEAERQQIESNWESAVSLMGAEIREAVHHALAPCPDEEFFVQYKHLHRLVYDEDFIIN